MGKKVIEDIFNFLLRIQIWDIIRAIFLVFLFSYIIFAVVIWRQTFLMSRVLEAVNFSPFLKFLAIIYLGATIFLFLLALGLFLL